jgi:hypothetical protein
MGLGRIGSSRRVANSAKGGPASPYCKPSHSLKDWPPASNPKHSMNETGSGIDGKHQPNVKSNPISRDQRPDVPSLAKLPHRSPSGFRQSRYVPAAIRRAWATVIGQFVEDGIIRTFGSIYSLPTGWIVPAANAMELTLPARALMDDLHPIRRQQCRPETLSAQLT